MNFNKLLLVLLASSTLTACSQKASWHADEVARSEKQTLTVGEVQRNIQKGMSGGEVATILGSPNVVSTDENGLEVWIYDRFYTESVASGSNGLTLTLSNVAGVAARTSQSSITVIIKFNADKKVRDFAYHKSSF
tara:strand:+ start:23761 stop:24165 length:405 start_codon:yes stop_codon:yes gene_type:complete